MGNTASVAVESFRREPRHGHSIATPQCQMATCTKDNPADCASRGILGSEINDCDSWWYGPSWLQLPHDRWPSEETSLQPDDNQEEKLVYVHCAQQSYDWDLASRYSSWPKLIRVTAYIIKFISSCRPRSMSLSLLSSSSPMSQGIALSASDCQAAKMF